jgi:aminopeptidase N
MAYIACSLTPCKIQIKNSQGNLDKYKKLFANPKNLQQILEEEKKIVVLKETLEKHCRQFGLVYGKYGTKESEIQEVTFSQYCNSLLS